MSEAQDKVFFRNYSIVIGILAVLIIVCLVVARLVVPHNEALSAQGTSKAAENTAPVGEVRLAGEALPEEEAVEVTAEETIAASEEPADPGKQVYGSLCFSCHGTGLPGIPQLGDKDAWAGRIANGIESLYNNAIIGFTGASGVPMPAKGGNPALSDEEVKAAVDYMVANAQ
jgi:cytochrome c5